MYDLLIEKTRLAKVEDKMKAKKEGKKILIIEVTSGGYDAGNKAEITINGEQYHMEDNESNHFRGLHIIVIAPATGKIRMAQVFDTYKTPVNLDDFIINEIPDNYIVVAACKDDCTEQLSDMAKQWFVDMGSKLINDLRFR